MGKWQRMARARQLPLHPTRRRELVRWAESVGFSEEEVAERIREVSDAETWMNNVYVATIHDAPIWREDWPQMKQLSIRRIDRRPIHDWRHLQQVKADIFGPEAEAVELYPGASRVVDTASSFHLFVLTEPGSVFPFGWARGLRSDESILPGQQRPGSGVQAKEL